ncbi:LamB/YcsF family protein [Rhizobium sp. SSA_523]|uniref:LamB/YcsF family protein n=1 Tax=Rhizobium sp. SSA_523 TaxID=2952477 RepID=UPI002090FEE5|nr:5-oxoprolinase subunit PxpA [Rhizobium sp. SSA_523]MCO5732596.1 LamB/YcsF family protein [Rhizobium sp. SSA_523]WKC23765.1 5-oxoprolinase subunit PxpA [Rhizobium sp. SSA_523]
MRDIDINSDLGESFGAWTMGDDAAMLDVASSANIACGFHAGDPLGIFRTLTMAADRRVAVGAHVGYRDLAGFGRRAMVVSSQELRSEVIYQIGALQALAKAAGTCVTYVKPHGALYNAIAFDERQAADVIAAIQAVDPTLTLMALAGSPLIAQARAAGLDVVAEAFADRAYTADGELVSRLEKGSVLHEPEEVAARMIRLVREGVIESVDGKPVRIEAQSICVHGDSPDAVAMARCLRMRLQEAGLTIRAFATRGAPA